MPSDCGSDYSDDDECELIFSPVLNFVQSNWLIAIEEKVIVEYAVDFFELKDIKEAKSKLWAKLNQSELAPGRSGTKAADRHVKDILDLFKKCDQDQTILPTYVIKHATEVPVIPAAAHTHLASKVAKLHNLVESLSSKLDNYNLNFPELPPPSSPISNIQTATVLLTQVPAELSDPVKRKQAIDRINGHELVTSVRAVGDKWYVNIDKSAADDFSSSAQNILAGTKSKLIVKRFNGIMKGVPSDFPVELLMKNEGIVGAKRLGSSKAVKLEFEDAFAKASFVKNGIRIGYEIFKVTEFKEVPKCCFKCRSPAHVQSSCPCPVEKCARCAGPHSCTKEQPCTLAPKCANCDGEHVSFSMTCPVLRNLVDGRRSK